MRTFARIAVGGGVLLVVLVAAFTVVGAVHHPVARIPEGTAGAYVAVSGTQFRYVQAGSGRDLLLIHGSPGSADDWEPVFDRLARKYRVTAYDRPGHGYSEGWTLRHTPEVNGHIALELIAALQLKDVLIVGHSYGGNTALNVAARNPPNVHGYVVIGTRAYEARPVEPLYRLIATPLFGRGFAVVLSGLVGPSKVAAGIRQSFGPNVDAIPPDFIRLRTSLWTRPEIATTLAEERVTLAVGLDAMAPRYAGIEGRVDLVYGREDPSATQAEGRLAREIPRARLHMLDNTGHYVQFARPDALIAVIDEAESDPLAPPSPAP